MNQQMLNLNETELDSAKSKYALRPPSSSFGLTPMMVQYIQIKEKHAWNEDKTKDFNSPGVFYFKDASMLKKYCQELIQSNEHINEEFYMSLPFNYLVRDGLKVWCPSNIDYFCQWGTPEDLEDYLFWINAIGKIKKASL